MEYLSARRSGDVRHFRTLTFVMALFIFGFTTNGINAQFLDKHSLQHEVSLTCTFSEDISEKKQTFQIVEQQDNALYCQWKEEKDLYCSVGQGYTYDWKCSETVTVRKIPSEEPEPSTCSCFLVGHDDTKYERPCAVKVTVQENKQELANEPEEDSHSQSQHLEESRSQNFSTELSKDSLLKSLQSQQEIIVVTAVGLTAAAVLLLVLIGTFIVVCRRYGFRGRKYAAASQSVSSSNSGDLEAGPEKTLLQDPKN